MRRDNKRRAGKMTDREVVGLLGRKIVAALNGDDGDLSEGRKENLNYYAGAEYGNEREGYSKFVTREAMETIEWVLPSVLRVFLSGDEIVTFDPVGPDDIQAAKQETAATNYFIMKKNRDGEGGFLALHHWMKDCLMNHNGYIKLYMEEKTVTDVGTVSGLTDVGVNMLVDDPDVEILEQRSRTEYIEATQPTGGPQLPRMPQPQGPVATRQPIEVFDLRIRTRKKIKEMRLEPVPPEEMLIDKDCTSINLDSAGFLAHRRQRTFTDLVESGIDADELSEVGRGDNYDWNDEKVNRLFYDDENPDGSDDNDPSMRLYWVHECVAWYDYNGDGIAERYNTLLIGDTIFEQEETNYQPFVSMASILMPHKHTGMSYIDLVKDLQLLSSTLTRQLLDNIYKINVRRKVFSEDSLTEDGATMDALLNPQAEFIPVRGPANMAFVPEPTQSIVGELLPVITHVREAKADRTGVTPESGVDANALQEVRQEVFSNAMDRASQRVEMLVRIFAETGYSQLMLKAHQLLRSHWDVRRTIQLRGKWIDVDPQGWRDRTDVTINVGLGINTKQITMQILSSLISMQKEAAAHGLADPKKAYNALEKMVNAAGVGDVNQFFIDPDSPEYQPPQPPPDPNMILAQAQAQALQADSQRKDRELQFKYQTDGQKAVVEQKTKVAEFQMKQREFALKEREIRLKEIELQGAGLMEAAEVRNKDADTQLKRSQSDKAIADAVSVMVEASDTYQQAAKIVAQGGELNDGESGTGQIDTAQEADTDATED